MNITLLNARANGGAFVACNRLLKALKLSNEANPSLYIQKNGKANAEYYTIRPTALTKIPYLLNTFINQWALKPYRLKRPNNFSSSVRGTPVSNKINFDQADVIHLHWINDSFIDLKTLKTVASNYNKPVFWTLHDLWPITGGCHYPYDCKRYTNQCGSCPELSSNKEHDLSRKLWQKKKEAYSNLKPVFIGPSQWMGAQIKKSTIGQGHPVHVIPNAIDTETFKPKNQKESRQYFNLPNNKKFILFGAMNAINDQRKGFQELIEALNILDQQIEHKQSNIELLVFGNQKENVNLSLSTNIRFLGALNSQEGLVQCYNAADLFVIPSKQDNLPNTIMEALACGVPSIGFKTGGIPDMIDHAQNGFLAENGNSEDLAQKIQKAIELDEASLNQMKEAARQKVLDNYTYEKVANQHLKLYQQYLTPSFPP